MCQSFRESKNALTESALALSVRAPLSPYLDDECVLYRSASALSVCSFCTLGVSQIEGVGELGGRAHLYVHRSGEAGEAHGSDKSPVQRGKGNKDEGYLYKCVFFSYFADRL